MNRCIAYLRKSTVDKKGLSIPGQRTVALELVQKQGFELVKTYSEERSALHTGRQEFTKLMDDIRAGKAEYIVCWQLNRLARNMDDGGAIIHALQNKIIKGIVTANKTYLPDHAVYEMLLEFGVANQSSRDLSSNVKRGNKEKIRQGGWPAKAPVGYVNIIGQYSIETDSLRGPLVRKAFELYSTGRYSLQNISDYVFDAGLTTRPSRRFKGGNKIRKGKIHTILSNPFYYGMMRYNGKLYPGNHKTLISQKLFEQCQEVMTGKARSRVQRHFFLFRGLCRCSECDCMITAEKQRGHSYYHCTNGKGGCSQKKHYLRGHVLEDMVIQNVLSKFKLSKEDIEFMYRSALEKSASSVGFKQRQVSSLESEIQVLDIRLSRLADMFLDGRMEQAMFDQKKLEMENDRQNSLMRLDKAKNATDTQSTIEQVRNCLLAATTAKERFLDASESEKRKLLFLLLSNITLKGKKVVSFQYKQPYNIIAKAPENGDFALLWALWDDVRTYLENKAKKEQSDSYPHSVKRENMLWML